MGNHIRKKIYYRIVFRLASALSVGSGENRYSDSDVARDSAGDPFIPGSSLAGLYRSLLPEKEAETYFGTPKNQEKGQESKVLVYDGKLSQVSGPAFYRSSIRDCVGLDQWKTGKSGSKFDLEIIEPGAEFVTYLEQNLEEKEKDTDIDIGLKVVQAWRNHQIRVGRKTMRGLGAVRDITVCRRSFDFTKKEELEQWVDFDMYLDKDWEGTQLENIDEPEINTGKAILLEWTLKQKGGISIRRYTTNVSKAKTQPDAEQLTCVIGKDGKETPYIPGTSWAGTFRHHMERLAPGCTEKYFGSCEKRSSILFCESFIEGAAPKVLTRNAVDRFTGGVIENALFTEKTWYGGKTVLRIEIPPDTDLQFRQTLAASLTDLHMGLVCVGGLTAVGRGIFEGERLQIDQEPVNIGENLYEEILKRLERG